MRVWLGLVLLLGFLTVGLSATTGLDDGYEEEEGFAEEIEEPYTLHVGRVIRQVNFPGQNQGFQGNVQVGLQSSRPQPQRRPVSRPRPQQVFRPQPQGQRPQGPQPQTPAGCNCARHITCAAELNQIRSSCVLPNGAEGVCCPPRTLAALQPSKGTGDGNLFSASRVQVRLRPLDNNQVNAACQKGLSTVNGLRNVENGLVSNNIVLPRGTPASGHRRVFKVSNDAKAMDKNALAIVMASKNMMNDFRMSPNEAAHGLRNLAVSNTVLGPGCPQNPRCNFNSKYRTIDGSCNNKRNPTWGKSNTPLQRILPPTYDDGVMEARTRGTSGQQLPNPRHLANSILVDRDDPDQQFTLSVMQWAQFLDHDIAHVPFPGMENGEMIECCPGGREAVGSNRHPRCWPINLTGDQFYGRRDRTCMNFIRSMLAVGPGTQCTFGYAEQLNQITHWLDGSNVYGSTEEEARLVRGNAPNGQLAVSQNNLLPINPNQEGDCEAGQRGALCYLAGDSRVNEQPGLTAIHTLWMREHNRIARDLKALNPGWNSETVYQEARRIVVAEMQHISYNEWLPIIVGPNFMQSFGINVRSFGYSFDYNPNFNPNMNNEFSTAAFRFGHTLVQGNLRLFGPDGSVNTVQLRDHFNSPHLIQRQGALDSVVRSFTQLAIQKFDSFITQDLTNHLFQSPLVNFGMDLMSLNIHRGRDHGIATYNDMRQICGLPRARNFQDITDQIPVNLVQRMASVYQSVDDIDFFVGGLSERPVSGGLLGWTFLCVVGDQFARLKKGDRYFYDLGGQAGSFSEAQLQEIRSASWARILCDNGDNIRQVQPLAFMLPNSQFNRPVPCNSPQIPRPNLQLWRGG